jgi:hypothetical protein
MLINNLQIDLSCDQNSPEIFYSIRDRTHILIEPTPFDTICQSCCFDLEFPNTLYIDIVNNTGDATLIKIKNITLSGLRLTDEILNQICNFKESATETTTVTRNITGTGEVSIDLFAEDWIQYHLLYGNKIQQLKYGNSN